MKKVIGIIGSLRTDSVHRTLFKEYQHLAQENFELTEGEIKALPLFNQDLQTPKDATELATQIDDADGVIFFSPEYNYSIPGVLKNAIDWLSRDERQPFDRKPSTIIGASPGNVGTARMQYHLRQVGVYLNLSILNKPEVMIGKAFDKITNGKITDESTVEFLQKHVKAFSEHLSRT